MHLSVAGAPYPPRGRFVYSSFHLSPVPLPALLGLSTLLGSTPGEYVIITAAGSALGRMAIRYAKSLGVGVVATCRRAEQVAELKQAG
jgi:NADPH:quinone reductase-like Zn-dependent oxidoreductase